MDGFQGQEKDFILISCVRSTSQMTDASQRNTNKSSDNRSIGFLADSRRLNVALTRAKLGCWLVGSASTLAKGNKVGLFGHRVAYVVAGLITAISNTRNNLVA